MYGKLASRNGRGNDIMRMRSLNKVRTLLGMVLAWALCALALAQDGTYRLMPEDIIRIQVYNETQINALLPIGKDGNVSAPFVGIIRAQGKTTSELEAELKQEYIKKLRLREPRVSVTIERFRPVRAAVGGFVSRPGIYEVRPGDTVFSLLTQGGGPVPDRADLKRATLRRANTRELIPIDLYAMFFRGDMSQNYEVQDGDELIVPEETNNRIIVMGSVVNPGPFAYREGYRLSDAIAMARGPVPIRAMMSKTVIVREMPGQPGRYIQIVADYVRFQKKGDSTQNIELQPGDLVYIPDTKTPDLRTIGDTLNAAFFIDRIARDGLFGFRLIGR